MTGTGRHGLVVIRSSREDLSDPTSHLLMPTAEQGPFPPFDRFAETVATRRIQLGLHPHLAEEVVTYVIDGLVHHEDGSGNHTVLNPGSVLVVTAHEEVRHELTMQPSQEGRSARWLSIVLRLPWHTEAPPTSVQIKDAGDATESIDGTVRRPVVGPSARAETFMRLECSDLEFTREADVSVPIDHGRRGVAYVLRGSGMIEKKPVEMGHGALFENVTRLALYGSPGFRVFLATVPNVESRGERDAGRDPEWSEIVEPGQDDGRPPQDAQDRHQDAPAGPRREEVNEMARKTRSATSATSPRAKLTFERTFRAATVDEVWDLWTTKAGLESWWGPEGFVTKVNKLELRPGGKFEYAMTATDSAQMEGLKAAGLPLTTLAGGTYVEVTPRTRLVYRTLADFIPGVAPYEVVAVVEIHGRTPGVHMVVTEDAMHDEQWTQMSAMGMNSSLDKLAKVLDARRVRP